MIVWLSYLVCVAAGAPCHVTLPTDQPSMGLAACQLAGEIGIPEWQRNHAGMYVAKVRCSIGTKPQAEDRV